MALLYDTRRFVDSLKILIELQQTEMALNIHLQ